MKTVMFLVSASLCCLVTIVLTSATAAPTEASVTTDTLSSANYTTVPPIHPVVGVYNGSKLVITKVVKTVEFVVGLEIDDNSTEYSTESTTPFIETDINVLNPSLLKELVKAEEEAEAASTESPSEVTGNE